MFQGKAVVRIFILEVEWVQDIPKLRHPERSACEVVRVSAEANLINFNLTTKPTQPVGKVVHIGAAAEIRSTTLRSARYDVILRPPKLVHLK